MRTSPPEIRRPLPGREHALPDVPRTHEVLGTSMHPPFADGVEVLYVAMGCFWGAERLFWTVPGVVTTAVGYQGGVTPNPTYEETCSGRTGHTEAVLIAYDPAQVSPEQLLKVFWENHDSTTQDRQGNDRGTQYRSAIYWTTPEQERVVRASHDVFQRVLDEHGKGQISTELRPAQEAGPFYYAEGYHQQYLHKNPFGYCNHGPNGCSLDSQKIAIEMARSGGLDS